MDAAEPTAIDNTQGQVHAGTQWLIDIDNTQRQLDVVVTHRPGYLDNSSKVGGCCCYPQADRY